MITEYNPFHEGHLRLIQESRRLLGQDTPVIVCMSGDFVQRGDFAVVRRQARAEAAVRSGADLVLELPVPWSCSSAEGFARGGVSILLATGIVTTLLFGSECGDTAVLRRAAAALLREEYPALLRRELAGGISFPAARQRAVELLAGAETARVLSQPNDLLGVEYCKSLLSLHTPMEPIAIPRRGTAHEGVWINAGAPPSSSSLRDLLRRGEREAALSGMAGPMRTLYAKEEAAGRAPIFYETAQRAILTRLRAMNREDFARFDTGREGLANRLYRASREAVSVTELLERAKTKRYPLARLRRMVLWAFLDLPPAACPDAPPYLRPLAMNTRGRTLLSRMRKSASVPVVIRPAEGKRLSDAAQSLLETESRCADLYALCSPRLSAAPVGSFWREHPRIVPDAPDS